MEIMLKVDWSFQGERFTEIMQLDSAKETLEELHFSSLHQKSYHKRTKQIKQTPLWKPVILFQ